MREYVHAVLGKLGSFADDYIFLFGIEEGRVEVSKPGTLKRDVMANGEVVNDDFIRVQKVVSRNIKVCASLWHIFGVWYWEDFLHYLHKWKLRSNTEITEETAERARMEGGYTRIRGSYYWKLSYLKHETHFGWKPEYFRLDDWIALHRNGKYAIPGNRINFQDLKYAEEEKGEGDIET